MFAPGGKAVVARGGGRGDNASRNAGPHSRDACAGALGAGDPRTPGISRNTVSKRVRKGDFSPEPPVAPARQADDATLRPNGRVLARGRPQHPEEAEAHRSEGVRPPPGRGGVRGVAVHGREVRPGVARGAPQRGRRLSRARIAHRHRPGRLRRVLRRPR